MYSFPKLNIYSSKLSKIHFLPNARPEEFVENVLEGQNILDLGHCISVCFGAFAIMAFYHILSRFFGTFFPLEEKCAVRICEGKLKVIT